MKFKIVQKNSNEAAADSGGVRTLFVGAQKQTHARTDTGKGTRKEWASDTLETVYFKRL